MKRYAWILMCGLLAVAACGEPTAPGSDLPSPELRRSRFFPRFTWRGREHHDYALSFHGAPGSARSAKGTIVTTQIDDLQVDAVVRSLGTNNNGVLVAYNGHGGRSGWGLFIWGADAGPALAGRVSVLAGGIDFATSSFRLTPGQWQHLRAVRAAGAWSITMDGVTEELGTWPVVNAVGADWASIERVTVGENFNGQVDEVRFTDLANHKGIERWTFNEGRGSRTKGVKGTVLELTQALWARVQDGEDDGDYRHRTEIKSCGAVINTPGRYIVTRDLVDCPDGGIRINSSDVSLMLNRHTIDGVGNFGNKNGIAVGLGVLGGLDGITITGPGTVRDFQAGLVFEQVRDSKVRDVAITGNWFGFALNAGFGAGEFDQLSESNEITKNTVTFNIGHGITMNGGAENLIQNNVIRDNGDVGLLLYAGHDNVVQDNTLLRNAGSGVRTVLTNPGNTIQDNYGRDNGYDAIDEWGDCTHNTWDDNNFVTVYPDCVQ